MIAPRSSLPLLLTALALSSCNCEGGNLGRTFPTLVPSQTSVDFGEVFVGTLASTTLTFENLGTSVLNISSTEIDGDGAVFSMDTMPTTLDAGESVELTVRFTPFVVDGVTASLRIESDAENAPRLSIPLSGRGKVVPDCDDDNACTADVFDYSLLTCANEFLLDTPCDDGNPCSEETRCAGGQCLGVGVDCPPSDNPCERGICDSSDGCVYIEDVDACDDDDPCTIDSCDAVVGCVHEVAEEGRPCGPFGGCDAIPLCIGGVCTPVDVPDGIPCVDGDSCTVGDQCQAGVCVGEGTTGPMESVGTVRAFGGPKSLSTVSPTGDVFVLDPSGTGVRLTHAAVVDGRLVEQGHVFVDVSMGAVWRLTYALDHVLIISAQTATSFDVRSFSIVNNIAQAAPPFTLELSRPENVVADFQTMNVNDNGSFAFFCSGAHSEVGVVELAGGALSVRPVIDVPFAMTCADVVYEVANETFVFAAQNVRTTSAELEPGIVSRWSIDAQGTLGLTGTLVASDGLPGCTMFSAQPLLLASNDDGLLLGCGTGAIAASDPFATGAHLFLPNSFNNNFEFSLPSVTTTAIDFDYTRNGELMIVGIDPNARSKITVCLLSDAGTGSCARVRSRPDKGPYLDIGADIATTTSGALRVYDLQDNSLRRVTGDAHGAFSSLDVVGSNRLASASQFSAHLISGLSEGMSLVSGGTEHSLFSDGYHLLSFGPQGSAPIALIGGEVGDVFEHVDASTPSAAFSLGEGITLEGPAVAANGVVYQLADVGGNAVIITQSPTTQPWTTVSTTLTDDRLLGGAAPTTRTFLHATEDRLVIVQSTGASSVLAIMDITNSALPRMLMTTSRGEVAPIDAAASGNRLVLTRGHTAAFSRQETRDEAGFVESFLFDSQGTTQLGVVDVPYVSKILTLEADHVFVANFSLSPLQYLAAFVELTTSTPTVGQSIVLDGESTALRVLDDIIYFASEGAIEAFSPPCPVVP